jgi:hypothetical protein
MRQGSSCIYYLVLFIPSVVVFKVIVASKYRLPLLKSTPETPKENIRLFEFVPKELSLNWSGVD